MKTNLRPNPTRSPRSLWMLLATAAFLVIGLQPALGQEERQQARSRTVRKIERGGAFCAAPAQPCDPNDPKSGCYQPPPPDPRCEPDDCEKCQKSPCYVGTGSYTAGAMDLAIMTPGFPLVAARRYDSTLAMDGPMGFGWWPSVASRLYHAVYLYAAPSTYQKEAYIAMPDGKRYRFVQNGDGSFTPPQGRKDNLVMNPDGTFELTIQRTRSVYRFRADGALSSMVDDYGNTLLFTFDGSGRVSRVADEAGSGRYLDVIWGPDGRISIIRDSTGRQIQFTYNPGGALTTATDAASRTTTYSYVNGRFGPLLSQITDHWNRVISDVTYDPSDRVKTYTEAGEVYTYSYNYEGQAGRTAKTDSQGNQFLYPFVAGGLVSDTTPPSGAGGPTHTDYYPDGLIHFFRDGVGAKTLYTYNSQGNPLAITTDYQGGNPVRWEYAYDVAFPEKAVSITPVSPSTGLRNPDWQGWRYDYHPAVSPAPGALHHVLRVRSDGVTLDTLATYEYNSRGQVTRYTTAAGGVTDYAYDAAGNLVTITSPPNNDAGTRPVRGYGYDALGRITNVADPLGHAIAYTYDALDRVTSVTLPKPSASSPLNFVSTYDYDGFDAASGLVFLEVTDANGKLTRYGSDQYGQLVKAIDPLARETVYGYARGLLTSITDANGNVTGYAYDAGRRLTSTIFPDGAVERYTYYGDDLLQEKTDRKGQKTTFFYDSHKRLSYRRDAYSKATWFTYQGQKLTRIYDELVSPYDEHLFTYDSSYRVVTDKQGPRGTISYTYTADDQVASYAVQGGGPTTTYGYYPDGSLREIVWTPVAGPFRYEYTLTGQYERIMLPNGQTRNYSYDDQWRLMRLANLHPAAGNLATYDYGYDLNHATGMYDRLGQRVSMTATVPAQSLNGHLTKYEYDSLYQLTKVTYPTVAPFNGEVHSWTYDALGNRLTNTVNGNSRTYAYQKIGANPDNWQRMVSDGTNSYTYDENGSAVTRNGPGDNFTFGWDSENRLASIGGTTSALYAYDYRGRRFNRQELGSFASYLFSGLDPIREATNPNSADFLFGPGIDEPLAMARGGQISYYVTDGLGSVTALAGSSGTVQNSYLRDVWGVNRGQSENLVNPFGYTSREAAQAGTLFYRARYLSPSTGRFLSEDPIGFRSRDASLYRYVGASPASYIDPLGLMLTPCDWGCGGAATVVCFLVGSGTGFCGGVGCWVLTTLACDDICHGNHDRPPCTQRPCREPAPTPSPTPTPPFPVYPPPVMTPTPPPTRPPPIMRAPEPTPTFPTPRPPGWWAPDPTPEPPPTPRPPGWWASPR